MHRNIKISVCFLAFSIAWLFVASLLNFHMNRIFHQDLIPQSILCKRFKDHDDKAKACAFHNSAGKYFASALAQHHDAGEKIFYISNQFNQVEIEYLSKLIIVLPDRRGPPAQA